MVVWDVGFFVIVKPRDMLTAWLGTRKHVYGLQMETRFDAPHMLNMII